MPVSASSKRSKPAPQRTFISFLAVPWAQSSTFKRFSKKITMLKPNGISRTAYPDKPAQDFNEWSAHITSQEIVRDADAFKRKFDVLWAEFKKSIQRP